MSLVETQGICFSFNERPVLHHVDFSIAAGEVVGLIGPNGAGKSTFLKILVRLLTPSSGNISLFGTPSEKMGRKKLAREMAYLPQEEPIHWPLSVERIVALGRIPHLAPWQGLQAEDTNGIHLAMAQTGTEHLAARPAEELAGGERRLVMLARVLAGNPAVILADEPVAGLDPNHQIQVMELLKTLARVGRGIVVVLHDLTLAARFCDRIYLMHEGKILASGKPREVLSPKNLNSSYHIQAEYGERGDEFYVIPWSRLP